MMLGAAALNALAIDFIYDGQDCKIVYRFTPQTGTLNDLKVFYNESFSFFPAYHGGITSFELGGARLKPWAGQHTSQLLAESSAGPFYQAEFRWSFRGESFDFMIEIRLTGKTLIIEYKTQEASNHVVEFGADRSEDTPNPKVLVLPYGHNVLWTNNVFVSAVLNPRLSRASSLRPLNSVFSNSSVYYSDLAAYALLTNGRRNNLNEALSLTVSPQIEETFVSFSNPVSPFKDLLSKKIILDVWRPSFSAAQADLAALAALGMSDLLVILHFWQKYGYDDGFPTTYPAGDVYGGPEGLLDISRICRKNGYDLALHTNYVDFYPDSDVWTPGDLALSSSGTWVNSWYNPSTGIQSYLMKPTRSIDYARLYEPSIHENYQTTAGYLDVHSAVLPSFKVDFDARVEGAGQQKTTFQSYRDLFSYMRTVHQGPLAGEGFGLSASTWAGYIDALEADPRSLFDIEQDRVGSEVPILVDFKLRALHGLFVPHGAGYLERFFLSPSPLTAEKLERYRATELAFGNAGFLAKPWASDVPVLETLREYCFLKHLQSYYLNAQPIEISYRVDGELISSSSALNRILPTVKNDEVNAALLEGLARVRIRYDNGFVLYVNRSSFESWDLAADNNAVVLPPGGFLGIQKNEFVAYTAIVQGIKRYFIWPAEKPCRGHLDDYIFAPVDLRGLEIQTESLPQPERVNLLTWRANPLNTRIVQHRIYLGQGTIRSFVAEVDGQTFQYVHRRIGPNDAPAYSVVAVNDEGREGEAASVIIH